MSNTRTLMELSHDACTIASWTKISSIVGMPVTEEEMLILNEHCGSTCSHLHGVKVCVAVQDLYEALVKHNLTVGSGEEDVMCIHGRTGDVMCPHCMGIRGS